MASIFAMDKLSGSLYTKATLDREHRDSYDVWVKATDGGGKFGYALIKVKVDDVNDNNPKFIINEYNWIVKDDAAVNSVVGKVRRKQFKHVDTFLESIYVRLKRKIKLFLR